MKWIKEAKKFKTHRLSGISLIVNDKILLVKPKKFRGKKKKYSIPKGHIEGDSLESALKEFNEETSMKLDENYSFKFKTTYIKNNIRKKLTTYVYIRNDFELKINKNRLNEIFNVELFNKKQALKKVEPYFKKVINKSFENISLNEKINYRKASKILYAKLDKFFHLKDAIEFRDELKIKMKRAHLDLKENNLDKEAIKNIKDILIDLIKATFLGGAYIMIPGSLLLTPFIQKFLKNENNRNKLKNLFKFLMKNKD